MPLFIKESIIYKFILEYFINPYNDSKFKKVLKITLIYFKESNFYKKVDNYFNKKPYFLNSLSYKFFREIIKYIDGMVDSLHKFLNKLITKSTIYKEINCIKNIDIEQKFILISVLVLGLNIGYIIGGIIFNYINLIMVILLFILSLILFLISKNLNFIKESIVFKYLF